MAKYRRVSRRVISRDSLGKNTEYSEFTTNPTKLGSAMILTETVETPLQETGPTVYTYTTLSDETKENKFQLRQKVALTLMVLLIMCLLIGFYYAELAGYFNNYF